MISDEIINSMRIKREWIKNLIGNLIFTQGQIEANKNKDSRVKKKIMQLELK